MSAEGKYCLVHRMSLRDHESKKVALLAKLKEITGFDYTFEVTPTWPELVAKVHKAGTSARDHEPLGEIFYGKDSYLQFIVEKFAEACKDEMIKEALLDATSSRKILFTVRDANDNKVAKMTFTDGVFGVGCSADRFNTSKKYICEGDISKFL